jgi:hypothetical protein
VRVHIDETRLRYVINALRRVTNWKMFKCGSDNIYNAFTLDDLIVCFGKERLRKFYTHIENCTDYFKEKYSAI